MLGTRIAMLTLTTTALIGAASGIAAHAAVVKGTGTGDSLTGTPSADTVYGYGGGDMITARGGDDVVYGGLGGDQIAGNGGADRIFPGPGGDGIQAGGGDDRIYLVRDGIADLVDCGTGFDRVIVTDGFDRGEAALGNCERIIRR